MCLTHERALAAVRAVVDAAPGVSGLPGEVDEQLAVAAVRAAGLEPPAF